MSIQLQKLTIKKSESALKFRESLVCFIEKRHKISGGLIQQMCKRRKRIRTQSTIAQPRFPRLT